MALFENAEKPSLILQHSPRQLLASVVRRHRLHPLSQPLAPQRHQGPHLQHRRHANVRRQHVIIIISQSISSCHGLGVGCHFFHQSQCYGPHSVPDTKNIVYHCTNCTKVCTYWPSRYEEYWAPVHQSTSVPKY